MKNILIEEDLHIAVASYDANWLRVVGCYCSEQPEIAQCHCYGRGKLLLQSLAEGLEVHVMVVDEQLQDLDLASFAEAYAALPLERRPVFIGVGCKRYLGYLSNLFSFGLTDFMAKPFELASLKRRMIRLYYEQSGGIVKQFCENLYANWKLELTDNTAYLTNAVRIACDASEKLSVRKEIVWSVAELHGCTHEAVDSNLRRLIKRLEEKAAPAYLDFKEENALPCKKLQVGQLVYAMDRQYRKEMYNNNEQRNESVLAENQAVPV